MNLYAAIYSLHNTDEIESSASTNERSHLNILRYSR